MTSKRKDIIVKLLIQSNPKITVGETAEKLNTFKWRNRVTKQLMQLRGSEFKKLSEILEKEFCIEVKERIK